MYYTIYKSGKTGCDEKFKEPFKRTKHFRLLAERKREIERAGGLPRDIINREEKKNNFGCRGSQAVLVCPSRKGRLKEVKCLEADKAAITSRLLYVIRKLQKLNRDCDFLY
jgi:hypothetical protein